MPPCAQLPLDPVAVGKRGDEARQGHSCSPAFRTMAANSRVAVQRLESPGPVDLGHVGRLGIEAALEPLQRTGRVSEGEVRGRDVVLAHISCPRGGERG